MTRQELYMKCTELLKGVDLKESVDEQFLIAVKNASHVIEDEDVNNSKIPALIVGAAISSLSAKLNRLTYKKGSVKLETMHNQNVFKTTKS